MNLIYREREFSAKEIKLLKLLISKTKNENKLSQSFKLILISLLIGLIFAIIASNLKDGVFLFITGTIAVFAFAISFFSIVPNYKQRKEAQKKLTELHNYLQNGIVKICEINTEKTAKASEYEDESDLYLIKINNNQTLFIWDYEYKLERKFPCNNFEIYEEKYHKLTSQIVNFKSKKVEPIEMNTTKKWNYLKNNYLGQQIEIIDENFEIIISDINNYS